MRRRDPGGCRSDEKSGSGGEKWRGGRSFAESRSEQGPSRRRRFYRDGESKGRCPGASHPPRMCHAKLGKLPRVRCGHGGETARRGLLCRHRKRGLSKLRPTSPLRTIFDSLQRRCRASSLWIAAMVSGLLQNYPRPRSKPCTSWRGTPCTPICAFHKMMGFPRWCLPIIPPHLNPQCRATSKFNLNQVLKRPSELCCVKFERRQGFPNWTFMSSSASIEPN